jgi:hypothetical protein
VSFDYAANLEGSQKKEGGLLSNDRRDGEYNVADNNRMESAGAISSTTTTLIN